VELPRAKYGTLNMFCKSYDCSHAGGPALSVLESHMRTAVLYAIFYNDVERPDTLREVLDLKANIMIDAKLQEEYQKLKDSVKHLKKH
jgi:hypothetical protein